MRNILLTIALILGASAAQAEAVKQVRYIGIHPVPKSAGGGFCYIEGPHVHIFGADKLQYRDHDGAYFFVGDPVAYGYDGPKHVYKGHHPVHVNVVVGDPEDDTEFCYLDGPHYHYFAPGPDLKVVDGAAFYVAAEPPRAYLEARPAYIGINAVYTPLVYARPVVTVAAPVGWIGIGVVAPGVVVAPPAAVVVAPGVHVHADVHIPLPSVHVGVGIGAPAVIVRERHGKFKGKRGRR